MTKPRIKVKSKLVFWNVVGLRLYFKFLPQLQQMIPISEGYCNQDFQVLQKSRKVRRSLFGMYRRVIFCDSSLNLFFDSCLQGIVLMLMFFEHLNQPCDLKFVAVHPAVSPLRSTYQVFCSQQFCLGFLRTSPHLLRFPRWSCFLYKLILWTTLRNNFQDNTRS